MNTARLILSKLCESDVLNLYQLDCDIEVRRYIDDCKPPESWPIYQKKAGEKLLAFSRYGHELGFWAARFSDGTFVGWFHLRPNHNVFPGEMEIGYRLHSRFWKMGLATEGAQKLLKYAFLELRLHYVMATTLSRNVASQRVMEKCGMSIEKTFVYPESLVPFWNESERAAVKYGIDRRK